MEENNQRNVVDQEKVPDVHIEYCQLCGEPLLFSYCQNCAMNTVQIENYLENKEIKYGRRK